MSSDDYDFLYNYALQQAERVQELENEYQVRQIEYLEEHIDRLEKENKRYREALNSIMTLWIYLGDRTDFEWLAHKMSEEARKALEGTE